MFNCKDLRGVIEIGFSDELVEAKIDVLCGNFDTEKYKKFAVVPISSHVRELPFDRDQFDYLYGLHLLEHVDYPEDVLDECLRIAKKGHIILTTEFAEILFGYVDHYWGFRRSGNTLQYRAKDNFKYGVFGDYFHCLAVQPEYAKLFKSIGSHLLKGGIEWNGKKEIRVLDSVVFSDESEWKNLVEVIGERKMLV